MRKYKIKSTGEVAQMYGIGKALTDQTSFYC